MAIDATVRRPVTHVIFDMDGLLLDTEGLYTAATQTIVGRFGRVFDWSVKSRMIGRPALESARHLIAALDLPITPEQYLEERERLLQERFPAAEAMPGAERLVRHLHASGVPQAVASSSGRPFFDLKTLRHQDWFELFDCVVLGDDPDVVRGKPAPDIFLTAARRMAADPARCLVIEDAPSGLQAALAAGMAVVAIPDPNMDKDAYARADRVLNSLLEFEPRQWGLPPFPAGGTTDHDDAQAF